MSLFNAVIVEDDHEQLMVNRLLLNNRGFNVHAFGDAASARSALLEIPRPIDLVVIDRRLPENLRSEPYESVGEDLLEFSLNALPDTPFVVFTGFADVRSIQTAVSGRGVIDTLRGESPFDRVRYFQKSQSIEFGRYVTEIHGVLQKINDVELNIQPDEELGDLITRRLLRKVAIEMGGTSISAIPLGGGLTGDLVADCIVTGESGHVARVITKESKLYTPQHAGGIRGLLSASHVASVIRTVSGLCDGRAAQISSSAGPNTKSLMSLILGSSAEAVGYLSKLIEVLDQTPVQSPRPRRLDEIVSPISNWAGMIARSSTVGVIPPRESMQASCIFSEQHGDLHAGNILVDGDDIVLIDFDSQAMGSRLVDPVTLILSSIFHVDSPFRDTTWPTKDDCLSFGTEKFWESAPASEWFNTCWSWICRRKSSDRELWTLVFAYCARQLKYDDIRTVSIMSDRATTLLELSAVKLNQT